MAAVSPATTMASNTICTMKPSIIPISSCCPVSRKPAGLIRATSGIGGRAGPIRNVRLTTSSSFTR